MQPRLRQLDGIRGVAILLVIMHNQTQKFPSLHLDGVFANGWMGVDLFFVLSGFLITGILLDTRQTENYFTNFYARRCLRIWPLYYAVVLFMLVVVPILRPSETQAIFARSSPWWAYPVFLQNLLVPIPTSAVGPLGVTWSLAIEEQFYLVWPVIVRFSSADRLRQIAITVICLSPVLRFVLSFGNTDLYSNTFCRLDGLMAGALLAVAVRNSDFKPDRFLAGAWICLLVSLPLAFVLEKAQARWIVFSLSAIASACLVFLSLFSKQAWLQRSMTSRFLVYTGAISYGLYLLHKIPFDVLEALHWQRYPLLTFVAGVAGSYGVAALSWNLLEKPFLNLKRSFEPVLRAR